MGDYVNGLLRHELDRARENVERAKAQVDRYKRELASSSGEVVYWASAITELEKALGT